MDKATVFQEMPDLENSMNDKVISAYESTIMIALYYAESVWTVFTSMLTAHSIIIAGLLIIFDSSQIFMSLKNIMLVMGLIMCIVWFILTQRAHEFASFYRLLAQEIEEKYYKDISRTLSTGRKFIHGETINFYINGSVKKKRINLLIKLFGGKEDITYLVIIIFIVFYMWLLLI